MKNLKTVLTGALSLGVAAISCVGLLPTVKASAASVETEVRPVAEYTFDKSGADWLDNTGSWGEAYDLQGSAYAKRENWGENSGGVNFSDDSCLYLAGDKYIFNELDAFTIAVDFYAERNANWYSSLFSWDVLSESGFTNMSRFSIGYKTGQDWLRYSDVKILGSIANEGTSYGAFFSKGETLLNKNVSDANSGWWKFIYSVQPNGLAITYLTSGTSNVNYIEVNKVPADYSLKNENGAFSIGGSFKNSGLGIEWKANAILDNLRIYDFAMTEAQMTELRWTSKVCKSPVLISQDMTNGSVTANKTEALTGERVLLDVQADDGYEIDKVFVNDLEILPLDGIYYTSMVKGGVSVYATFKQIEETPEGGKDEEGNGSDITEEPSPIMGCFGGISGVALPVAAALAVGVYARKKKQ